MKQKLIQQGAEAKIYITQENQILKKRTPKSYRHPKLDDQIRTRRTRREAKILTKASAAKINVPKIIKTTKFEITMQQITGERLSQTLNNHETKKQISIMKKIGTQVKKLHENNIIHADLTTSNTILEDKTNHLFLIDFGLSYISTKIEDKAVDIHLLKQALNAKHHENSSKLFQAFKETYKFEESKKILERLKTVESRGRYKH